jgi:hypothetical protein
VLTDDIRAWIGIFADIGVVAGFALLVVQMRQSTRELRQRRRFESVEISGIRQELAFMGTTAHAAHANAVLRPERLTESELSQVWSHLNVVLYGALLTWGAWRRGEVSEHDWIATRDVTCEALGFDVARIVWRHRRAVFPLQFVEAIEDALARRPADELARSIRAMMKDIRALPPTQESSTGIREGDAR